LPMVLELYYLQVKRHWDKKFTYNMGLCSSTKENFLLCSKNRVGVCWR
jgi:hypothetical protein